MEKQLNNKVALITGGTSGIGEVTAKLFIENGAKVVIAGRSEEKGKLIADSLGENALYIKTDVSIEEDIKNSIDFTTSSFGKLDILFNNAGGPVGAPLDQLTQKHIDYGVHLLLSSVILGTKFAIEPLKDNGGGSIINNSSIAAHRYRQGDPLYSALKAAESHFTRISGIDLAPHNIRVNAISPGAIATPIFWGGSQRANTLSDDENENKLTKLKGNLAKAVPLKRTGLPEDIANAAIYLASDAGNFITCQDIIVDGGRTGMFEEPNQ